MPSVLNTMIAATLLLATLAVGFTALVSASHAEARDRLAIISPR